MTTMSSVGFGLSPATGRAIAELQRRAITDAPTGMLKLISIAEHPREVEVYLQPHAPYGPAAFAAKREKYLIYGTEGCGPTERLEGGP